MQKAPPAGGAFFYDRSAADGYRDMGRGAWALPVIRFLFVEPVAEIRMGRLNRVDRPAIDRQRMAEAGRGALRLQSRSGYGAAVAEEIVAEAVHGRFVEGQWRIGRLACHGRPGRFRSLRRLLRGRAVKGQDGQGCCGKSCQNTA